MSKRNFIEIEDGQTASTSSESNEVNSKKTRLDYDFWADRNNKEVTPENITKESKIRDLQIGKLCVTIFVCFLVMICMDYVCGLCKMKCSDLIHNLMSCEF